MKCQHCDKPATFHITELTEEDSPHVLHLCEDHARVYLAQGSESTPATALANMLAKQLKIDQAADRTPAADQKVCPVCGITFSQFRNSGRLGCAYDYVCFRDELEPLLVNIHGAITHRGKRPSRAVGSNDHQHELIQMRREMSEAIEKEDYEKAGKLRDEIKLLEVEAEDQAQGDGNELKIGDPTGDEPDSDSSNPKT